MSYLDISVAGAVGTFTKSVKPLGLRTEIFLKIPAWDLTTVRVLGEHGAIAGFINTHFEPRAAAMHLRAIKAGEVTVIPAKNRALMENRS